MNKEKLRILFLSEFSMSSSGYSKLFKELMSRLYKLNKYEIAELASYCSPNDDRIDDCPWKVYPTLPNETNKKEVDEFNGSPQLNAQGRWKFNETCLDFLPDVVFTAKDVWYDDYTCFFPFRNHYHLIWWNPVDGEPLEPDMIARSIESDACFTYTKWGLDVLKEACGNKGNIQGIMPLGVNQETFFPIPNKISIKQHFGFKDDILVAGFVCRNQPRKLIASLIEAFALFLSKTTPQIRNKVFLYLHTAWPDISWNIPQLLKDYGVGGKVLFTYQCGNCGVIYPTVYSDIGAVCNDCGRPASKTARTNKGIPDYDMNVLYNFMDCYFQVSSNEGLGIPAIEAIGCAVPTFVSDYSGSIDIINIADAIPIKTLKLIREMETGTNRYISIPDTERLAAQLHDIFSLPEDLRRSLGYKQYLKGKDWFSWDKAVDILTKYLDTVPKSNWHTPSRIHKINKDAPFENMSAEEVINWGYSQIIGRPELFNTYRALHNTYEVMMGMRGAKPNITMDYTIQDAINNFIGDTQFYNHWESLRLKKLGIK